MSSVLATNYNVPNLEGMELFNAAHEAGLAAGNACTPNPMLVGVPTTPFGNDIDYSKRVDYISEGPCGFAWVVIRPANCKFVNILKKNGIGRKNYGGGWCIWVSLFNQSMARKEAYASAFAKVLRNNGIENAYSDSRMD
jgi:hypothetical protein